VLLGHLFLIWMLTLYVAAIFLSCLFRRPWWLLRKLDLNASGSGSLMKLLSGDYWWLLSSHRVGPNDSRVAAPPLLGFVCQIPSGVPGGAAAGRRQSFDLEEEEGGRLDRVFLSFL
jgi:hypothetical protein